MIWISCCGWQTVNAKALVPLVNCLISVSYTHLDVYKRQLRILYGDHYKFQVWSEPGKGTEIEIAVPIERVGNYVESDSSR